MTAIALQFSTEPGLASDMVRLFDHCWCSHVDCLLEDGSLLGARYAGGVQVRQPGYVTFTRTQRVAFEAPDCVWKSYLAFLQAQVGKPYDSEAIAAFALDRDWRATDSWFCSELIVAALEHADYFAFPPFAPSNRITPGDLMLMLSVLTKIEP